MQSNYKPEQTKCQDVLYISSIVLTLATLSTISAIFLTISPLDISVQIFDVRLIHADLTN